MLKLLRCLLRLLFRFRAFNEAALKAPGPVLLLPNHVSWFDWLFLGVCLDPDWRFVTSSVTAQTSPVHRWIMVNRRTFPVDHLSPYAAKRMAEYLQHGGRLVLFPEGRMSVTGSLMKLYDGTGFLLHKTGAKVITCILRGAQRLPFSPNDEQKQLLPRITAHFSDVQAPPRLEHASTTQARLRLTSWLRDRLIEQEFRVEMELGPRTVPDAIVETARRRAGHVALQDVTRKLTYRRLVQGAALLARQFENVLAWPGSSHAHAEFGAQRRSDASFPLTPALFPKERETANASPPGPKAPASAATLGTVLPLPQGEGRGEGKGNTANHGRIHSSMSEPSSPSPDARVGVLLPNVNALPVTLLSLWSLGKVPAILNYTTGPTIMRQCCELAGLKQIITSRAFLSRAKLDLTLLQAAGIEFIYLEDVRKAIGFGEKLGAALGWIRLKISPPRSPDDAAVVLFTSGSEGVPKGVELSHTNLLANLRQMLAVCDMQDGDRFFTALPLFHSFGLTAGLLLPLVRGAKVFLYPSPLHYRVVPTVLYDRDCTVLLATNTFLNGYARRAHPLDFRSLRYLFAGAEKVQDATAALWAQRFGVRVLEGYGATECSPVISVNVPLMPKHGSAGRFVPGMEWRLEPVEGVSERKNAECRMQNDAGRASGDSSFFLLPSASRSGRLFVRGPNVMRGYLNADANAQFQALGGWYDTGDIVSVDDEGFVHILGRLKRFAKVSGEMVSLTAVEDALAGAFPEFGLRCQVAVIARPCDDKGEKLIAVTNESRLTLDQIRAAIRAKGLSNLCVPREIKVVKEIPKLGTGKVNHRELERLLAQ